MGTLLHVLIYAHFLLLLFGEFALTCGFLNA